ncbi:MAG: hypothetical protein U9N07_08815 [Euryarchaeota archaeon]|nr:hypothetical protein [Euryarchaeota archaeon]
MDFEELRNILTREQRSKLAKLEPDFYESVRAYLDGLREEQKTASDREAPLLADEFETAGDHLQRIFKLRVGKIVKLASLNISMEIDGTRYEVDAMTPVERDIYHSVLAAVRQGWSAIVGMLTGESGPPTPEEIPARMVEEVSDVEHIEDVEVPGHGVLDDYTIVRVLKDIPTFMGADSHHYTLAKNDVVTLPNLNAKVLCKRRVVSPVAIQ